jgi:glutathione S-transferase
MLKLTYLPISARGFPIRFCLRAANISFDDVRIPREQLHETRGIKGSSPTIPLGQLPTLEMANGELFTQSIAISRWAAQQATDRQLYPTDLIDSLRVEEIVAVLDELWGKVPLPRHFGMSDGTFLTSARQEFVKSILPKYCEKISSRIKTSGGPFVLGKNISFADVWIVAFLIHIHSGLYSQPDGIITAELFKSYPYITTLFDSFKSSDMYAKYGEPN